MPVPVYTDLFNAGFDELVAKLSTVVGLQVNNDARNITPPSVFVNIDSVDGYNFNVAKLNFTLQIITLGPGNLDAMRNILSITAAMLAKRVAVTAGSPGFISIGGQDFPCYDLDISLQAQAAP